MSDRVDCVLGRLQGWPLVRAIDWCWAQTMRPVRFVLGPLERRITERRARRLEGLADVLEKGGLPRQAAEVRCMAEQWRSPAS